MSQLIFSCMLAILLAGCTMIPSPQERHAQADSLAAAKGWLAESLPAGVFRLVAHAPHRIDPADLLTVYIEGDGFAWINSS